MKTEVIDFKLDSSLAGYKISCKLYAPVIRANVKAVFQIAHGMAEHKERYDRFCEFLAENGYAVFIHDHLGHGESVNSEEDLGWFGDSGGWRNLVEDCYIVTQHAQSLFSGKPYIFFGHSMGSFIARAYSLMHGKHLAGAIYCGTSGPNPAAGVGSSLADAIARTKGNRYKSELINTIAFGSYNKRIKPAKTDFDWLSVNEDNVAAYIEDPLCGYLFSATGYRDLFNVLKFVSSKKWFKRIRKDLPVLLIAGAEDPVGEYGAGVKKVASELKKQGQTDVKTKIYPGLRHEILLEDKEKADEVMADVLKWADSKIK